MVLIRVSSSSRRPLAIAGSSSRMKWVKTWSQTLVRRDRAATNMPHCVIS